MPLVNDTIAAIATAPGRGGIGIVRVSGPLAISIIQSITGILPLPRRAYYSDFRDKKGNLIDQGIIIFFPKPHSFTGEDVAEFHGHGGPVILNYLLKTSLQLGARLAKPGEFTERAFLNEKIDLAQAEAIADLIDANSEQAVRAAMRSLQGDFSKKINELIHQLTHLRMYIEAAIDFPEEEIDFLSDNYVTDELEKLLLQVTTIYKTTQQGVLLKEGVSIVIAGLPNAGKSSLLNALSGRDSAIVTPIAGTTRDILQEYISIDGIPIHIIDTAGLRESTDIIEQEGIKRAKDAITRADKVLWIIDSEKNIEDQKPSFSHPNLTFVLNKIDLLNEVAEHRQINGVPIIKVSAKTGAGISELKEYIKTSIGYFHTEEGNFIARQRHLNALDKVKESLIKGQRQLKENRAGELLAEELRLAQQFLGEITGEITSDDLLGKIFANFCIGK